MTKPLPPATTAELLVSDHAVLRYLERAHGVPVEAIRASLAASAVIGVKHGAPVVVLDAVKLVIRSGRVVTTLKRSWPTRPRRDNGR